jgi:hypothetical protein
MGSTLKVDFEPYWEDEKDWLCVNCRVAGRIAPVRLLGNSPKIGDTSAKTPEFPG